MSNLQVLLIDDNPAVANALELAFRVEGHSLKSASSPEQAHSLLARHHFDAILLDLNYSAGRSDGSEGLACLGQLLTEDPAACIVVLTAHGGMRIAVAAMQAGARDFVVKPWNNAELIEKVAAAAQRQPVTVSEASGTDGGYRAPPQRLLGNSPHIAKLRDLIRRVGPTDAGVAVTGPSGSGRTLAATLIHNASAFSETRPVAIDLRTETAWQPLADATGTAILRHVEQLGEVEQEQLVARLPDSIRPISILSSVDPLIPALRRRIATLELRMPPLAEREEDAPLLARHFAEDAAARFSRPVPVLEEGALDPLRVAGWPDEVRGLALAIERAVLLSDDDGVIDRIETEADEFEPVAQAEPEHAPVFNLDRVEKALIERALSEYNHNVSHAARALGLSRGALYRRMERHGL
ncbi:MAG: response regulator [Erythrobacter sp.]|nr:response regulator [Erythrobacter sp.]